MTASIRDRAEWPKLLGHYDPVVDIRHRWFVVREEVERFLASLTSEELDELVRIVQAGGADEPLAHDVLVVLARRFDSRLRGESLKAWQHLVRDEVWASRKQTPAVGPSGGKINRSFRMSCETRLPVSGGGALLIGPDDVRCEIIFTPVGTDPDGRAVDLMPVLEPDDADQRAGCGGASGTSGGSRS